MGKKAERRARRRHAAMRSRERVYMESLLFESYFLYSRGYNAESWLPYMIELGEYVSDSENFYDIEEETPPSPSTEVGEEEEEWTDDDWIQSY